MARELRASELKSALERFAEVWELRSDSALTMVVCGGAGLNLAGYTDIGTYDVDVIALEVEGNLETPEWSEEFQAAREAIAEDMGLRSDWINRAPATLIDVLPEGFQDRLDNSGNELTFGPNGLVKVKTISQYDQIFLKTYAALNREHDDPQYGKHVNDLRQLDPAVDAVSEGVHWALEECDDFPDELADLTFRLRELGSDLNIPDLESKVKTRIEQSFQEE